MSTDIEWGTKWDAEMTDYMLGTPARDGASGLVLSCFPGIGLLDMAFEELGHCVVRGPDVLWGGDIRRFHPPRGVFWAVIGGPPCQVFSRLRYVNPKAGRKQGNLIPEFERVVGEAQPDCFLMENVPEAPEPVVPGYIVRPLLFNNRWTGAEQNRLRRFSFGTRDGRVLAPEVALFEASEWTQAVTASAAGRPVPVALMRSKDGLVRKKGALRNQGYQSGELLREACRLQGLPEDFLADAPFTLAGKFKVVGNGVPLPIARAVTRAMQQTEVAS